MIVICTISNYRIVNEVLRRKTDALATVKQLLKKLVGDVDTATLENVTEIAQQYSEEFSDMVTDAWTRLMSIEVDLHEQMEVYFNYYELCIGKLN